MSDGHSHLELLTDHLNSNLKRPLQAGRATDLLNLSLDVLYRAGTCAEGCSQGDHQIERLACRAYNLAAAATLLTRAGLYDEARSLTRSIAEIVNLLALFWVDRSKHLQWVNASPQELRRGFSPVKVRLAIEHSGDLSAPVDQDWYRDLCETATHVTPATVPNPHQASGRGTAGALRQEEPESHTLEQLAEVSHFAAFLASKMVGQQQLFELAAAAVADEEDPS